MGMAARPESIVVPKDPALAAALARAAALAEPGTSESTLLRDLAVSGAENLMERPDPTPEQIQRVIDQWMSSDPPWDRELLERLDDVPHTDEPRSRFDAACAPRSAARW